jgi:hypothetical protein
MEFYVCQNAYYKYVCAYLSQFSKGVVKMIKMTFIPALGEENVTHSMADCPVRLMSFMQKMM